MTMTISREDYKKYKQTDVRKFYKSNLQGKDVVNPVLGKIIFSQRGLGETIHRTPRKLLPFVCILKPLVETGKCDGNLEPLYKQRKDRITGFYHIKNSINLSFISLFIDILIGEDQDGKKYYMFKKDPQGYLGECFHSQRGPSGSNYILTEKEENVKGEIEKDFENVKIGDIFWIGDCIKLEVVDVNLNKFVNESNKKAQPEVPTAAYVPGCSLSEGLNYILTKNFKVVKGTNKIIGSNPDLGEYYYSQRGGNEHIYSLTENDKNVNSIDDITFDIDLDKYSNSDLEINIDTDTDEEETMVYEDPTESYIVLDKDKINNDNFKRWFDNSYCCNRKGDPIVVYHSTNAEFNTFNKKLDGSANGRPVYGGGFCFSAYENYTKQFGKHVMPCVLSIQKPIILRQTKLDLKTTYKLRYGNDWEDYYNDPEDVSRGYLIEKSENVVECFQMLNNEGYTFEEIMNAYGYDGIIDGHVFVVVRPNQIKSINNNGSWSKNSDNIYEALNREIERYL